MQEAEEKIMTPPAVIAAKMEQLMLIQRCAG